MSDFEELAIIPARNVFGAARVSTGKGELELRALVENGTVRPVRTPTGRTLLTPADGRIVYEALTQAA